MTVSARRDLRIIVERAFAERPEGVQFRFVSGVRDTLVRAPPVFCRAELTRVKHRTSA